MLQGGDIVCPAENAADAMNILSLPRIMLRLKPGTSGPCIMESCLSTSSICSNSESIYSRVTAPTNTTALGETSQLPVGGSARNMAPCGGGFVQVVESLRTSTDSAIR